MKLLILNKLNGKSFAKKSLSKFCFDYFKDEDWIIKYTDEDWKNNLKDSVIVLFWFQQQVPLNIKPQKGKILTELVSYQSKHNFILIDYMEDVHHSDKLFGLSSKFYKTHFSKNTKNYILVRSDIIFKKIYSVCNYYCLPFSVDSNIIPEFNNNLINKILMTGRVHHCVYPMRLRLRALSKKHPIELLEHPGYGNLKHDVVGKSYLDYVNKYIASVSTCGSWEYNYVVAKYFEIPATGALLFAYMEPIHSVLVKYGFRDGENMISFNKNNVLDKIYYVIDPANRKEIDRIRLNGYNLIKKRHTHETRFYKEFDMFINSLLK